jgi:hypothetical protein
LDDDGGGRRKLMIIGAAVAAALVLILVLALRGGGPETPPVPDPAAGGGGSVLAPSPRLMDSPLLNPQRPIGAARRVAGEVEENRQEAEDAYLETQEPPRDQ